MPVPLVFMLILADPPPFTADWLGPALGVLGGVIVAGITTAGAVWRRRQDRQDTVTDKATESQPNVTDGWEEVRRARAEATFYYNLYRAFEELYYTVASALRKLSRKVREHHPDEPFDPEVVSALELKPPETEMKK